MTVGNINVEATIKRVRQQLEQEKDLSPAIKSSMEVLLVLVSLLLGRLGLDSSNSSKPPSTDQHRKKVPRVSNGRKPGGQPGRSGKTLQAIDTPDEVKVLLVDRNHLPPGNYREVGYESRQVVDLDISRVVTEFRAQVLESEQGKRYVAPFPKTVTRPVQYGNGVKVHAVYMSQYQMVPYQRIGDHLREQMQIPVSLGSIYNFNQEAHDRLEAFDRWVKTQLASSFLAHADETGINIGGKGHWLHSVSNDRYTHFAPHAKRGTEAMDEIGILPAFRGILCHDHWRPYFRYDVSHALCNAHISRELRRAFEQDEQQWADKMMHLLQEINKATQEAGGHLDPHVADRYRSRYRILLDEAEKECPPPDESRRKPGQRGRLARSKARSLLERLREYEKDVLRFMVVKEVPFTNNQAENDLRMTKVQQKISGCFRSRDGAEIFCRVRSYLSTCRKHGITAAEALRLLFDGKLPGFMLDGSS
jgi:transposase